MVIELRVIGIGSPFGDDRLGWDTIQQLQKKKELQSYLPHQLDLLYLDRPGLHLLEFIKETKTVFLIDAVKASGRKGELYCLRNEAIEGGMDASSTHTLGLHEVIQLGKALNTLPQDIVLYGIELGDIVFEFALSSKMQHAVERLSCQIAKDIVARLG